MALHPATPVLPDHRHANLISSHPPLPAFAFEPRLPAECAILAAQAEIETIPAFED
jgi:hypothetical protein